MIKIQQQTTKTNVLFFVCREASLVELVHHCALNMLFFPSFGNQANLENFLIGISIVKLAHHVSFFTNLVQVLESKNQLKTLRISALQKLKI